MRVFFVSFYQLTLEEIASLKKDGSKEGIFNLMRHYTGHVTRRYSDWKLAELPNIFKNVYWLCWHEDGKKGPDWRGSILCTIDPFVNVSQSHQKIRRDIFKSIPFEYENINYRSRLSS